MENFFKELNAKPGDAAVQLQGLRSASPENIELVISAIPWWSDAVQPHVLKLELSGVCETNICLPSLETTVFTHSTDDPLLLDYGPWATVFGNAPLPDPPKFIFDFYDLVSHRFGIERDPLRYLNTTAGMKQWLEFVYSRSYCLLTAPLSVAEAVKDLLDAQAAEHMILPDPIEEGEEAAAEGLGVLRIGPSWFIHRGLTVEFVK